MNQCGQVLTWKLTKSVAFTNIEDGLLKLKKRLDGQGRVVHEFYVDICCSWRSKLQEVFGPDLKVYLDLFHAVKRVSSTISKRHPLHYQCTRALSMVFRQPTDHGNVRTKPTPPPTIMLQNMKCFVQQWQDQTSVDGRKVFSPATRKEIDNLCKHIEKGCLSDIQPGRGTNRNEALHKSLNAYMKASRYGVELAYMLLTTAFFNHNEKIAAQGTKRSCKLILEHEDDLRSKRLLDECFGIPPVHQSATKSVSDSTIKLSIDKSSYHDLLYRFTSADISTTSLIKDAMAILLQALSWYTVHSTMSKCTSTATMQCTDMPFTKEKFGFSCSTNLDTGGKEAHAQRLSDVLTSWNFRKVEVPGDGNCLFTAVALHLQSVSEVPESPLNSIMERLGINRSDSIHRIVELLRQAVVAEWLGEYSHEYTSFLAPAQLEREAERFLLSGEFSGDLGDLVVTALSNVLHSPIILFTSIDNLPLLVVTPTNTIMENPQPIHLTFTQYAWSRTLRSGSVPQC